MIPVMIPGFSPEQSASLQAMITAAVNEAFDKHFGPLQHSTPPAPREAQKEVEQAKRQPLHQATVEDDTESTTKHGSTMPDSKNTLSSMPCLCATRSSGDSAACLSITLFKHASCLASFLTSFFGDFLNSFVALASFLAWHGLLPGYIECTEGMEATGQG